MPVCASCGASVSSGASFCPACGKPMPTPPPAAVPVAPVAAAPAAAPAALPYATPVQPAGAPAASTRPVGVTVVAILAFIGAAFSAFGALIMLVGGAVLVPLLTQWDPTGVSPSAVSVFVFIAAIAVLGFAALAAACGYGLLKGHSWAWVLTLILAVLYGLGGLFSLAERDFEGIVALAVGGGILWYFLTPEVKAYFRRPGA